MLFSAVQNSVFVFLRGWGGGGRGVEVFLRAGNCFQKLLVTIKSELLYFRWSAQPRTMSTRVTSATCTNSRTWSPTGSRVPTLRLRLPRVRRRCTSGATSSSRSSCRRSTRRRRKNPSQRNMWLPWFR